MLILYTDIVASRYLKEHQQGYDTGQCQYGGISSRIAEIAPDNFRVDGHGQGLGLAGVEDDGGDVYKRQELYFTTGEFARILGVKKHTLFHYCLLYTSVR